MIFYVGEMNLPNGSETYPIVVDISGCCSNAACSFRFGRMLDFLRAQILVLSKYVLGRSERYFVTREENSSEIRIY